MAAPDHCGKGEHSRKQVRSHLSAYASLLCSSLGVKSPDMRVLITSGPAGCSKEAVKKLELDGVPLSSIPNWLGGTCAPVKCHDYINQLIASKRRHGT